ncbi:peptidase M23-like protein [Aliiruegeria haliotis]|uniref:Peptidase M23-like protein n=1 Tax=Aliiruegeria haliotis TaxID=1280846 RepID=A0A2T0RR36_9RHOB|nr:M23 family metallopeptidase [Aliiruegeria haliotis]PRY23654.1 peptidase M23-like protein [Aliiruegeria haliotis]
MTGYQELGRHTAPLLVFGILSLPVAAEAPTLGLPLECTLGVDCHIQQYVDRDPGPGVQDFACGNLANDGHKGTDFAISTLADMGRGVPVVAAAPGIVRGVRDGMPDIDATDPGAPDLTNRECGNGVAISHGDDWETQYCHLRNASVRVQQGQKVEAGEPLGLVGMSGLATFPHVHFSVRKGRAVIDPFQPDMSATCGLETIPDLWQEAATYRPGGLLQIGVLDRVPDYSEVKDGLPGVDLPNTAPSALVVWGFVFGGDVDDEIELSLAGPGGALGSNVDTLEKRQPFLYRAWGKKAPKAGFPPGAYRAEVVHRRGGEVLDHRMVEFELN